MSKHLQVKVFRRDRWTCRWCNRPVIFAPAMKYLDELVRLNGFTADLAYHHPNWRRDNAPLLDELGAVVDHIEAHSRGGSGVIENLVTSCNRCNIRKGDRAPADHTKRLPTHRVKGKYGEPQHWDGLSTVFIILIRNSATTPTDFELQWLGALTLTGGAVADG